MFLRTTEPISTKPGKKRSWVEGIQVDSNEEPRRSPRGNNSEIVKFDEKYLKSFSSEPLGQSQPNLVQMILGFCSNEGPRPSQRGDNSKIVKLNEKYLKTLPQVSDVVHGPLVCFIV